MAAGSKYTIISRSLLNERANDSLRRWMHLFPSALRRSDDPHGAWHVYAARVHSFQPGPLMKLLVVPGCMPLTTSYLPDDGADVICSCASIILVAAAFGRDFRRHLSYNVDFDKTMGASGPHAAGADVCR